MTQIDAATFNIRDVIYACGSPLDALVYSRLLWPEFVEVEGMVFVEGTIESQEDRQRLAEALKEYGNDLTVTERLSTLWKCRLICLGAELVKQLKSKFAG